MSNAYTHAHAYKHIYTDRDKQTDRHTDMEERNVLAVITNIFLFVCVSLILKVPSVNTIRKKPIEMVGIWYLTCIHKWVANSINSMFVKVIIPPS